MQFKMDLMHESRSFYLIRDNNRANSPENVSALTVRDS